MWLTLCPKTSLWTFWLENWNVSACLKSVCWIFVEFYLCNEFKDRRRRLILRMPKFVFYFIFFCFNVIFPGTFNNRNRGSFLLRIYFLQIWGSFQSHSQDFAFFFFWGRDVGLEIVTNFMYPQDRELGDR